MFFYLSLSEKDTALGLSMMALHNSSIVAAILPTTAQYVLVNMHICFLHHMLYYCVY